MADMVRSAVIQETVSQILSGMVRKHEDKEEPNATRNMERLEMAHIRLQAALEVSDKWHLTDASLLRWRRKLKRAAQECDDMLQNCKQRVVEDEQMEQEVRNLPFPKRVARATKSFILSQFSRDDSSSGVQRFEWFADGASEFLRFVELGGTPRHLMPFDSLIRHLLDWKKLQQKIVTGSGGCPLFLLWVPFSSTECGIEASLSFIQKDGDAPEDNFYFGVKLQISESTDLIGVAVKCLQLFPPHLKSVAEVIRRKVTQLPTLDFCWVPFADSGQREHWGNLHSLSTQWSRPDPLCCKQDYASQHRTTSNLNMAGFADGDLEPVIEVDLLCHIARSEYSRKRTLLSEPKSCLQQDCSHLQVVLVYMPHGSSEETLPADEASAVTEILGEEKRWLHADTTFEELNGNMLRKARDYFHHDVRAATYQMIWRSEHGGAYVQVNKASSPEGRRARRSFQRRRETKVVQLQDQELGFRGHLFAQFFDSWGRHAPTRLRGLILSWVQKEMERQLLLHQGST